VASKLLGEVELEGETTLELILLLLLDEGKEVLDKGINVVLRTTKVDSGLGSLLGSRRCLSRATVRNLSRDLFLSKGLVVAVDVPPDLVVELDGRVYVSGDNLLLAADEAENVLLSLLQGALVRLGILCARCLAGKLVVGRRHAVLEHKKSWRIIELIGNNKVNAELVADLASSLRADVLMVEGVDLEWREAGGWVTADEVHNVGTSLESILAISGENLPRAGLFRNDAHVVLALDLLNGLAALKVSGDIASVALATARSRQCRQWKRTYA
jgi:hypothetical protein